MGWSGDKYRQPYPHNQRGCFQDLNPWPPSHEAMYVHYYLYLYSINHFWISFIFKHDSTKFSFETLWRKIIKGKKIQDAWIKKYPTTYQALRWFFLVASTLSVSQEPNEEWYYSYRDNIKEKLQKNWHFKLKMVSHTWTTWASPPKIWKGIIASCGL